jgi:hypothetical protein
MLSVQDSATTEESEKVMQPDNVMGPESASNLLSSGINLVKIPRDSLQGNIIHALCSTVTTTQFRKQSHIEVNFLYTITTVKYMHTTSPNWKQTQFNNHKYFVSRGHMIITIR